MKLKSILLATGAAILTAAIAAQAQVPGVNSTLNSVFTLTYDNSTMKPTYSASSSFAPAASAATDICILNGSATKNIRVRRIFLNLLATTAISKPIAIIKRSTANSGGTAATIGAVPYDSTSAAATAVMQSYTTNPTTGTAVGTIADPYFSIGDLTTGGNQKFPSVILFGELGSPIVLRGVAQSVAVNLQAQSFSGAVANCTFEWTEE